MDSEEYQRIGEDQTLPELAKDFIRLGMLLQARDQQSSAWLHAAWVCDDEENEPEARKCRKKAYDILADNYESGRYQHYADYVGNPEKGLRALDLLRRSQHFELARQKIDKIKLAVGESTSSEKEVMEAVVRFQAEKIGAQDARNYTIRDAINYVPNEAKNERILKSLKAKLDRELLEIEKRQDLTEEEKVAKIINWFSIVCAAVAIQPLPFADIMILTPIQVGMAERLASIRGIKVSKSKAKDILIEVGKVVGLGLLAQQTAIGLYKTILPGLGGLMSIPLVYGLTYGIGRVLDFNYMQMRKGRKASKKELKRVFEQAKAEGKKVSKQHRSEIKEVNDGIQ